MSEVFGRAAPEHFAWQTRSPMVGDMERALVRGAFLPTSGRVLDVGCAEGATLHHLDLGTGAVGIDLFGDKLAFAAQQNPRSAFVVARGERIPFRDGTFSHVFVRDVIHHVDEPQDVVDEARRVLAPGGRLDILEPCAFNPLIFAHAILTSVDTSKPAIHGRLKSGQRAWAETGSFSPSALGAARRPRAPSSASSSART